MQFILLINAQFDSVPNMKKAVEARAKYHIYNKRIIFFMDTFQV